jgi:Fe-S oxidoreductase
MKTKNLEPLMKELITCTLCGYCKNICPPFEVIGWDSSSARGRNLLSYGLLTGEIEVDDSIIERMYQCTMCYDCTRRCPSDVKILDIIKAARADFVESDLTLEIHNNFLSKLDRTGNIFDEELKAPKYEGEVPVLLGCRFLKRKDDAKKYLEMLRKLGIEPITEPDETCCGMPYATLGYMEKFKEQQEKFRRAFPHKKFITLCTTCQIFLESYFPEIEATYVADVIVEKLPTVDYKKFNGKVTFHDPCTYGRGLGNFDQPRKIIEMLGMELVEMKHNRDKSLCCGGGGGLLVTDGDLASAIALRRIKEAADTNTDKLLMLCPTCELNFSTNIDKSKMDIDAINLLDLVYEAVV